MTMKYLKDFKKHRVISEMTSLLSTYFKTSIDTQLKTKQASLIKQIE